MQIILIVENIESSYLLWYCSEDVWTANAEIYVCMRVCVCARKSTKISNQCDPNPQVPYNQVVYVRNLLRSVFNLFFVWEVKGTGSSDFSYTGTDLRAIRAGC